MFNVQCSMFNVQCSMFNVQCSMFNVQCSTFNVQRSMFNVQCSMFNVQCSMFNAQCSTSLLFFGLPDLLDFLLDFIQGEVESYDGASLIDQDIGRNILQPNAFD